MTTRRLSFVLATTIVGLMCAPAAQSQELILHLPLDGSPAVKGGTGEAKFYTAEGSSEPVPVEGVVGQALLFEGESVIATPFNLDHAQYPQVTVTAWIREQPLARGTRAILSTGSSAGLRLADGGGTLGIKVGKTGINFRKHDVAEDQWVFVAGVVDVQAGTARLHQDDVHEQSVARDPSTKPPRTFANPDDEGAENQPYVFIGANDFRTWGATARPLAIDDVRVYAGALDEAQIDAIRTGALAARTTSRPEPDFDPSRQPGTTVGQVPEDIENPDLGPPGSAPDLTADTPLLEDPRQIDDGTVTPDLTAPTDSPAQTLEEAVADATDSLPPGGTDEGQESRRFYTVDIVFPGDSAATSVPYYVEDGEAVVDGDMVLGPADRVAEIWAHKPAQEAGNTTTQTHTVRRQPLNGTTNSDALWPGLKIFVE